MTSFEQKVYQYIQKNIMFQQHEKVLVACSGGIDSIVLLHYLFTNRQQLKIEVAAIHVNHMLRGNEAMEDRQFVQSFCEEKNIPLFATNIPIPMIFEKEKGNLQAICRRERYAYFEEIMYKHQFSKLAVAHHGDDQVENVLMSLTKGAIDQGILGMKAIRDYVVRPFLIASRQEIEQYLAEHKLTYREDASNLKDSYVRNRMRHHVVPLLKRENGKLVEAVTHFSEKAQAEDQFLQQLAEEALQKCTLRSSQEMIEIDVILFQNQSLALQRRIILLLLKYLYKDTNIYQSYTLWNTILKLATTTAGSNILHLPKGGVAIRQYDVLLFSREQVIKRQLDQKTITLNEWVLLPNNLRMIVCDKKPSNLSETAKIYFCSSTMRLMLRTKRDGDRIQLKGMTQQKKLARLFIDEKIPQSLREIWPLLVTNRDEIVAVPGIRVSNYFTNSKEATDDLMLIVDQRTL